MRRHDVDGAQSSRTSHRRQVAQGRVGATCCPQSGGERVCESMWMGTIGQVGRGLVLLTRHAPVPRRACRLGLAHRRRVRPLDRLRERRGYRRISPLVVVVVVPNLLKVINLSQPQRILVLVHLER